MRLDHLLSKEPNSLLVSEFAKVLPDPQSGEAENVKFLAETDSKEG